MELPTITDEDMRARLARARTYTLMVLRKTAKYERPAHDAIVTEHGRRNMALVEAGLLNVVCPVGNDPELAGIGIFDADLDRVRAIYDEDPGVQAGIFQVDLYTCRGFPGATLA
ncbi:MAG TPA: YciI family protein [Chloroflexota bacterium]|jgi:hypothetical protein|nr:YciI family protein [Chloroflexota bacterium]